MGFEAGPEGVREELQAGMHTECAPAGRLADTQASPARGALAMPERTGQVYSARKRARKLANMEMKKSRPSVLRALQRGGRQQHTRISAAQA